MVALMALSKIPLSSVSYKFNLVKNVFTAPKSYSRSAAERIQILASSIEANGEE